MKPNLPTPRRSCLYMPGANARALEKARSLPVDVVIMDLEDAVAPDAKSLAREQVVKALSDGGYAPRECWVRINGDDSPECADDIAALAQVTPDAVLVPKVSQPAQLSRLRSQLAQYPALESVALWAMIETAEGIVHLADLAAVAAHVGLAGFVVGTNDLIKELRLLNDGNRTALQPLLSQTVVAARAAGIEVLDGVFNAIDDPDGLQRECVQGRMFGFDGKTLIHPSQIDAANAAFAPSELELSEAQAICAAFALPENAGKGVITVNGRMTERLHLEQAERTLALQAAIDAATN